MGSSIATTARSWHAAARAEITPSRGLARGGRVHDVEMLSSGRACDGEAPAGGAAEPAGRVSEPADDEGGAEYVAGAGGSISWRGTGLEDVGLRRGGAGCACLWTMAYAAGEGRRYRRRARSSSPLGRNRSVARGPAPGRSPELAKSISRRMGSNDGAALRLDERQRVEDGSGHRTAPSEEPTMWRWVSPIAPSRARRSIWRLSAAERTRSYVLAIADARCRSRRRGTATQRHRRRRRGRRSRFSVPKRRRQTPDHRGGAEAGTADEDGRGLCSR